MYASTVQAAWAVHAMNDLDGNGVFKTMLLPVTCLSHDTAACYMSVT